MRNLQLAVVETGHALSLRCQKPKNINRNPQPVTLNRKPI